MRAEVRSRSDRARLIAFAPAGINSPHGNRTPRPTANDVDRKTRIVGERVHRSKTSRRTPDRFIPGLSVGARRLLPSGSQGDRDHGNREISRRLSLSRGLVRDRHLASPGPHALVVAAPISSPRFNAHLVATPSPRPSGCSKCAGGSLSPRPSTRDVSGRALDRDRVRA